MLFTQCFALAGLLGLVTGAPNVERQARKLQFMGVNEAGPDFGSVLPGLYNKDYIWPDLSTIQGKIDSSFNVFRINFMMERLTPNGMTGGFEQYYLANLTQTINAITSRGAYAMIQPHNYGRYYGQIMTSTQDFGTWWKNVATVYKNNDRVIFDTNNEFYGMAGRVVADMNQAAINGIRAAGAEQTINVEGNHWTGAWTWTTSKGTDGLTNAETMGGLTDPLNKIVYQMHQYLDSDGSGTSPNCVSSTIGSERLVAATNWLRANKKKGLIGEFAGGVNSQCQAAVKDMLAFMAKNSDVWTGAIWWAAGPWWGDYMYSIEPKDGPAYSTYTPILKAAA
ncbi:glycoside hydrolase family 5 protein [Cercospora zeae-maydis SCOH1-5]|uniref:cellulase n=1 Tax=Cercospora zeae-maydis SCOH1-5 TaxID=717836 RepID=A0A6A6FVL0_9PEZI|nr:glycoside hydrolase family 5 protein [Cercospora zeae-maydis SCOH1-5]